MHNGFDIKEDDLFNIWKLYNEGLGKGESPNNMLNILSTTFFQEILYFASVGLFEYNKQYADKIKGEAI